MSTILEAEGAESREGTTAAEETRARRGLPTPVMRKAIRTNAGLSLRRMARELNVSVQCMAHWEAGTRTPRAQNVVRYAELLRAIEEASR